MANWVEVGRVENFPPGTLTPCRAEGRGIVVGRVGSGQAEGTFFAVRDVCPHAGKPLHDGSLCGHVLTCRHHGYAYDVRSGRNIDFPYDEQPARLLAVRVRDGRVEVQCGDAKVE